MPFSKSALVLKIDKFYDSLSVPIAVEITKKVNIEDLEKKITKLTDNFRENLVKVIKEHYDN